MKHASGWMACSLVVAMIALTVPAHAQTRAECEKQHENRSGQAGKDVIWIPTQDALVNAMLKAAKVTSKDLVMDLGSGDGKIPIAAAKQFGATAVGIEYNPQLVKLAQCFVKAEGLTDKVEIRQADIFETDISKATVVTLYLLSDLNLKLRPTILKLKPGTRIVSNSFQMGDWIPDQTIDPNGSYSRGYLWYVPAQVEGRWTFAEQGGADKFQAQLGQKYQEVEATPVDGSERSIADVKLSGVDIQFNVVDAKKRNSAFKGTVEDDRIVVSGQRNGKPVTYIGTRS